jgi:2-amino-4-hydroxy-6-hydroxymethyldihydropteridine diphosphokinase
MPMTGAAGSGPADTPEDGAGGAAGRGPPVRVVLALGSNLGDRMANLQGAVDALTGPPGLGFLAVSAVYETTPVGGPRQPDFMNAVLLVSTSLPARLVLDRARAAEAARRRVRGVAWGPRTLDVDVIAYDDVVNDDPVLTLPHPRAHERSFVLVPWLDVDPGARIPGRGPVAGLLSAILAPPGPVAGPAPAALPGAAAAAGGVRRVPGLLRPPS